MLDEDLIRLQRAVGGPRLSLFVPLVSRPWPSPRLRRGIETMLARAEQDLRAMDVPAAEAADLLDRVQHAVDQIRPLGERHRGCALFADSSVVHRHHVDFALPALAAVGDRFAFTPLLPALDRQGSFYVLALTYSRIDVFVGTAVTLRRLGLEGFELAAWSTMPTSPALPRCTADERAARMMRHVTGVDRALRQILGATGAPLILSGEPHLQALYRAANTYPHLIEPGLDPCGRPDTVDELHRQAWALVAPRLTGDRAAATAAYDRLRGTDRVIVDRGAALRAAADGKVTALLVDESLCAWPAGEEPTVVRAGTPAAPAGLLEAGVADTLDSGGEVFVVSAAEMREAASVVAIRR